MSKAEKKQKDIIRVILVLLLFLLIGIGLWKCPTLSNERPSLKMAEEKPDRMEVESSTESTLVLEEAKNLPADKELLPTKKEEIASVITENKEAIPTIHTKKIQTMS